MTSRHILAAIALTFALCAQAQSWTLQQCIDWAREHSITVAKNRVTAEQAKIDLKDARANRLPTVSFTTRQEYSNRPFQSNSSRIVGDDVVTIDNKNVYSGSYGINASMSLYDGGKTITIADPMLTADVLAPLPLKSEVYNSMGMDQDNIVLMPYTTVMKRILAQNYLQSIYASAITEEITDLAIKDVTAILREGHKLREGDDDNFTIRSQEEISSMLTSTMDMLTLLLGAVAGISLVVGGIGIMNIMYVSVTERTREIGLRMSVGARGVDILSQFLIEAIMISVTGGLIGVLLGMGASAAVESVVKWPISVQPWTVMLAFAVCTFTGIFFGWYPAKKAANLDPIEAIRYE